MQTFDVVNVIKVFFYCELYQVKILDHKHNHRITNTKAF